MKILFKSASEAENSAKFLFENEKVSPYVFPGLEDSSKERGGNYKVAALIKDKFKRGAMDIDTFSTEGNLGGIETTANQILKIVEDEYVKLNKKIKEEFFPIIEEFCSKSEELDNSAYYETWDRIKDFLDKYPKDLKKFILKIAKSNIGIFAPEDDRLYIVGVSSPYLEYFECLPECIIEKKERSGNTVIIPENNENDDVILAIFKKVLKTIEDKEEIISIIDRIDFCINEEKEK